LRLYENQIVIKTSIKFYVQVISDPFITQLNYSMYSGQLRTYDRIANHRQAMLCTQLRRRHTTT